MEGRIPGPGVKLEVKTGVADMLVSAIICMSVAANLEMYRSVHGLPGRSLIALVVCNNLRALPSRMRATWTAISSADYSLSWGVSCTAGESLEALPLL